MIVKRLLIAGITLLPLLSVPAVAAKFDGDAVAEAWHFAHGICRGAYEADTETSERACGIREKLTKALQDGGYCFDKGEQEWAKCRRKP